MTIACHIVSTRNRFVPESIASGMLTSIRQQVILNYTSSTRSASMIESTSTGFTQLQGDYCPRNRVIAMQGTLETFDTWAECIYELYILWRHQWRQLMCPRGWPRLDLQWYLRKETKWLYTHCINCISF